MSLCAGEKRVLDLPCPVRTELHRDVAARRGLQKLRELEDARATAGTDVECARIDSAFDWKWRRGRDEDRASDISDVDIITGLFSVTEDRQRVSLENSAAENSDHSRFAVRILPRTVNVAEAQRDGFRAVDAAIVREVVLAAKLRNGIWRLRVFLVRLVIRRPARVAVERTTRRGEDRERLRPARPNTLHEIQGADDVARSIENGIVDALADIHLRSEMRHDIELPFYHDFRKLRRSHAELVKARSRWKILPHSRREIVHDGDVPAFGKE